MATASMKMAKVVPLKRDQQHGQDIAEALASRDAALAHQMSLFNLLPVGVIVLDAKGLIVEANPMASSLLDDNLIGTEWLAVIQRCFAPREDDGFEISLKNGKRLNISTTALTDTPGQMIVLSDLTATRALQQQRSQQTRLQSMGKMIASLAHQLRTPLSSAMLYAANLTNSKVTAEQQADFTHKLQANLHDIESQISDMLIFARGGNSIVEPIHSEEFVENLIISMDAKLKQKDVEFSVELMPLQLNINIKSLQGAIQNLMNNAIEACAKPVKLELGVLETDNHIVIYLDDNGPGLEPLQFIKSLEPFHTTKSNGTGLGLPVVNAVAKAHGGELRLGDSILGGSRIEITLPKGPLANESERGA